MGIFFDKKNRRQFLLGTGKSMLLLPMLPSMMPKELRAQATAAPARLMTFWANHNNLFSMWMNRALATGDVGADGIKEVTLSSLSSMADVSSVLNASIYNSLRMSDQLTFLSGYDSQGGSAHGNFGLACGEGRYSEGGYPTFDSVVERSSIYPEGTPVTTQKAIRISIGGERFYEVNGGTLQQLVAHEQNDLLNFYDQVFSHLAPEAETTTSTGRLKSDILSGVTGTYNSFINSARISRDDSLRLEQHMDYISDLQKSYEALDSAVFTCTQPDRPASSYSNDRDLLHRNYLSLLAMAFKCGLTKYAVMRFESHDPQWMPGASALGGDGIHGCIHGDFGLEKKIAAYNMYWNYMTDTVAEHFLSQLNVEEGNSGRTYLDNMITEFNCNGGLIADDEGGGHRGRNNQQLLIGSMGGKLRSGKFYLLPEASDRSRIPYNCHMITLAQLLGMQAEDYEQYAEGGSGYGYYSYLYYTGFQSRWRQPISEILNI